MSDFELQLERGHAGEKIVDRVLRARGCGVIQSYAFLGDGPEKAPRLRFLERAFVLPDLDVVAQTRRLWAEVKTLFHAPLNRTHGINVHGIRRSHYDDYLRVERETGAPVFLFVLEVATGDLLTARLATLRTYQCLCRNGCRPWCLVYFNRADFKPVCNLNGDSEFEELRATFKEAA
jgi:hypothetical protein